MKKRALASLLSLCLLIGLMPASVLAAENGQKVEPPVAAEDEKTPTNLSVGGISLIEDGMPTGDSVEGVVYENGTLILSGASISQPTSFNSTDTALIYAEGSLNVALTGQNMLRSESSMSKYAIYATETLTVVGPGGMTISNVQIGLYGKNLNVDDIETLDIGCVSCGIRTQQGDMNIRNSSITIQASDTQWGHGIDTIKSGNCSIQDSSLTVNLAINIQGTLELSDVTLDTSAIFCKKKCEISGTSGEVYNSIRVQGGSSLTMQGCEMHIGRQQLESNADLYILNCDLTYSGSSFLAYDTIYVSDDSTIMLTGDSHQLSLQATRIVLNKLEPELSYLFYIEAENAGMDSSRRTVFVNNDGDIADEKLQFYTGMVGNKKYVPGCIAYMNGGTLPMDNTAFQQDDYTLYDPEKTDHTFEGWYADNAFTGEAENETTAGTTYYARWKYTVRFDANGGEGTMADQTVTEGDTSTPLTANTFTKTGYTFAGWNTQADGSGDTYTADAVASTVPNGTTLYAQWKPNTYTISFNANGGTGTMADMEATYDTPVTLSENIFENGDANFAGWATTKNSETVAYSDGAQVENLTAENNGTVTLYAVWTDKEVLDPDVTTQTKPYNGAEQAFTLEGSYTVSYQQDGKEVTPKDAGTYDVVISADATADTAAYHNTVYGGLVITKAALTVEADNKSIHVGDALPAFTYTVSGWKGDDTDALLTGVEALCADADANKEGSYTITVNGPEELDNYTITYVDGTLTVSRRPSGGSGSSSSTTTETERNPDGSTTTTVTNKRTGTVTETTRFQDGSVLEVETKKDGTVTTTETAKNGVKVRTVDEPGEAVTAKVTIPRSVDEAVVTIPADVDYGMVAVDADTGEVVKLSIPTEGGMAVLLDGSAELILENRGRDFADTDGHWAEDAIDFAASHELFAGTSDTAFSPDSTMTRAMLMTVLARFDGQDTAGGAVWYEKGMAWAKENGISDGSSPDGSVLREQFAAMLWRYAGSPVVEGMALNEFGDSADINGYAVDAMRWAVSSGIIGGNDAGMLAPQGHATRAQVAAMLMRFVESLTK